MKPNQSACLFVSTTFDKYRSSERDLFSFVNENAWGFVSGYATNPREFHEKCQIMAKVVSIAKSRRS